MTHDEAMAAWKAALENAARTEAWSGAAMQAAMEAWTAATSGGEAERAINAAIERAGVAWPPHSLPLTERTPRKDSECG